MDNENGDEPMLRGGSIDSSNEPTDESKTRDLHSYLNYIAQNPADSDSSEENLDESKEGEDADEDYNGYAVLNDDDEFGEFEGFDDESEESHVWCTIPRENVQTTEVDTTESRLDNTLPSSEDFVAIPPLTKGWQ